MGSAEGTMSVFAKRLKQDRSWSQKGLDKFTDVLVALKDRLEIKTLQGRIESVVEEQDQKKAPKYLIEKLRNSATEATRNNIAYLHQAVEKPVVDALRGLRGI